MERMQIEEILEKKMTFSGTHNNLMKELEALKEGIIPVIIKMIEVVDKLRFDPMDEDQTPVEPLGIEIFTNGLSNTNWGALEIANDNYIYSISGYEEEDKLITWLLDIEDSDGIESQISLDDLDSQDLLNLFDRLEDILNEFGYEKQTPPSPTLNPEPEQKGWSNAR